MYFIFVYCSYIYIYIHIHTHSSPRLRLLVGCPAPAWPNDILYILPAVVFGTTAILFGLAVSEPYTLYIKKSNS